jgi:hypothetical protein
MLPWSFSEEVAAEKHMAQVQHNMWVANAREAVLSVITGGGKWVEIELTADSLYQHLLLTAEKTILTGHVMPIKSALIEKLVPKRTYRPNMDATSRVVAAAVCYRCNGALIALLICQSCPPGP